MESLKAKYPASVIFYSGYASYHMHPVNKTVHLYGVPLLWLSGFGIADCIFMFFSFTLFGIRWWFNPNILLILHFLYLAHKGDSVPVFTTAAWCWYAAGIAYALAHFVGLWMFWPMLLIHIGSWAAQVYAHNAIEHNKPAFADNVVAGVFSSPYFTTMEVLFKLGWNPEYRQLCQQCTIERKEAGIRIN